VQRQRAALQAAAGHQLQGHGSQAGDGCDAHGEQHHAGIFVFDPRDFAHGLGRGPTGQPQDQQQVQPHAKVPAGKHVLHSIVSGDEPGAEKADQCGEAQAWVGTGQALENHGCSLAGV